MEERGSREVRFKARLMKAFSVRKMLVTNLRNRPLNDSNIDSMSNLVLSLYHNLVTGDKDFPFIPIRGNFCSDKLVTPFAQTGHTENDTPSPHIVSPPGVMVPPAGSNFPPQFLTPVLPEKADVYVLKADRRNCVSTLNVDGNAVTRVISTVYRNEDTEMANRWRVTDYSEEGNVLMSVLCQFSEKSARCAKRNAEEESSNGSPTPPRKRLRL
ncbi:uncharacterized protein LOC115779766 isoform X2 [Archocentrus centrarchus]|uniref:uncharacterized protein LOC115779766 isoform X2 n=1 Tax=Archocentrus centrarchus TaxID=63155 RepID=UPI0011E9CA99|nr:uncharacterized protein LOC115779766 isoform X2 [Archocentrus centrarchus]